MAKYIKIMFYKVFFNIGAKYRNPSLKSWFLFLKKSESWSFQELQQYQLNRLKELISIADKKSAYYHKKFKKAGVQPKNIVTLSDLKKIPITEKKDLIKYNAEIQLKTAQKIIKASTSGSTGKSLIFYRNESADSFNRASILRGYSWYNVKYSDRNAYFWGYNFSFFNTIKTRFLDFLQNRFRLFNYQTKNLNSFINKLQKATYIHGYSSMIYQTAKLINSKKLAKPQKIKMVKGTSEKIFTAYQEEITKAFGVKMISEYGAAETGIIAFECTSGNMHINMEGVIVEQINNEIVVTNLQMNSFPVIRYKLGDYIKLAPKEKKCNCGLQHTILEEVTGRVGSNIYGKTNIYPSLTLYYIFKNLEHQYQLKLNYQVKQLIKGELIFTIEQQLSANELSLLQKEIKKYFLNDIKIYINDNQSLVVNDKKKRSFITEIKTDD